MELIHLPKIGLAAESVVIREFLKAPGETVVIGDEILSVETEKTVVEVQSSANGSLGRFLVAIDDVVPPGTAIAVVLADGEALDTGILERRILTCRPPDAPSAGHGSAAALTLETASAFEGSAAVKTTPRVRKLAAERGIDLASIRGTGPAGLVTEADLDRSVAALPSTGTKLTGVQAGIAARMTRAWREIPHIHQIIEIEADALTAVRHRLEVSLTPLLVKAAATALRRHPAINAHFDGETVVRLDHVNIAVAIGQDELLLTPVIPDADRLSVAEIAQAIADLRERLLAGRLTAVDVSDGSYTVSNLGMYGIETGTPIINPPQVGLMFVGASSPRPVLLHDGGIVERQFMKVTLSYDHRVVSGIPAARFSQEIRGLLQDPVWAAA